MTDRRPADRLGPDEYEHRAVSAAAEVHPGLDVEAMVLSFDLIRMANRLMKDLEVSVHRPAGVSFAAYRVLFAIRSAGRIVPNELARLSSVSTASMASTLGTLDRAGLITRGHDPDDGRRQVIGLTPEGERLVAELIAATNARERQWVEGVAPDARPMLTGLLRTWLRFRPPPATDPASPGGRSPGSHSPG